MAVSAARADLVGMAAEEKAWAGRSRRYLHAPPFARRATRERYRARHGLMDRRRLAGRHRRRMGYPHRQRQLARQRCGDQRDHAEGVRRDDPAAALVP